MIMHLIQALFRIRREHDLVQLGFLLNLIDLRRRRMRFRLFFRRFAADGAKTTDFQQQARDG